ncbi:unnamed protein product [Linum trigynum]|uniref:Uncharacterized protein n=1 Tax=Linum trigynum TaxID=586398 RepID=A0AAV2EE59_9ROSI
MLSCREGARRSGCRKAGASVRKKTNERDDLRDHQSRSPVLTSKDDVSLKRCRRDEWRVGEKRRRSGSL